MVKLDTVWKSSANASKIMGPAGKLVFATDHGDGSMLYGHAIAGNITSHKLTNRHWIIINCCINNMGRVKWIWYLSPMQAAKVQSHQNLRYLLIQAGSQEEPSDRKPDPWPLWMAGYAQLKFVKTECSKTQIRLMNSLVICKSGLAT